LRTGFLFSDIYDEVVSRAGGEQTTAEDVIKVRRGVRIVLQRWMNKSYNTWRIESTVVAAAGYSGCLALPADVDDIVEVEREGSGQGGVLDRVTADAYMRVTTKTQPGTPGLYWLDRKEPPQIHVHPIGYPTQPTYLRVWYVKTPADFAPNTNAMDDVPGRWLEALILCVAHDLASKRPPYDEGVIARLKGEAAEAEDVAIRADRDRARYRYRI